MRTCQRLNPIQHPENRILFLLVWLVWNSDRASDVLQEWSCSESGGQLVRELVQALHLPKPPVEIALRMAALVSLVRLKYRNKIMPPNETDNLQAFISFLDGSFQRDVRPLEHMSRSLGTWTATSTRVDTAEKEEITRILKRIGVLTELIPGAPCDNSEFYWDNRFPPPRSHNTAFSAITKNFRMQGSSIRPPQDEKESSQAARSQNPVKKAWGWFKDNRTG